MRKFRRLVRGFYQLLLPVFVLIGLTAVVSAVLLVYILADPPKSAPLVNLEKFAQLSSRGAQVTTETWENEDGSGARGWLLRGTQGSSAVVLLHKYGADRSHVLNLGVKLNETTNFTVLMPDLRGHGDDPTIKSTSFGGSEIEDVLSAIGFLKGLRVSGKGFLVGKNMGIYGIELGALIGLSVAARDPGVKAIAVDSVPESSDHLLATITKTKFPLGSSITSKLAKGGTYLYYALSDYKRVSTCEVVRGLSNRNVMLLAGPSTPAYQTSTSNLISCFPKNTTKQALTSMTPSGFDLTKATLGQVDYYDQRVIFFLKESLEK